MQAFRDFFENCGAATFWDSGGSVHRSASDQEGWQNMALNAKPYSGLPVSSPGPSADRPAVEALGPPALGQALGPPALGQLLGPPALGRNPQICRHQFPPVCVAHVRRTCANFGVSQSLCMRFCTYGICQATKTMHTTSLKSIHGIMLFQHAHRGSQVVL